MSILFRCNFLDDSSAKTNKYDGFVDVAGSSSLSVDSNGLLIDNKEFKTSILPGKDGAGDHVKYLLEIKDKFSLPKTSGELLYTVRIAAKQYFRNPNTPLGILPSQFISRINDITADPRLCCSAMTVFDDSTMMVYKFLITNHMFYAYYGRRPNLKTSWVANGPSQGEYASFASMVPLITRGDKDVLSGNEGILNDFNILSIGFQYDPVHERHVVTWYIDGVNVLSINQLGYRLKEEYQVLEQGGKDYRVGIGLLRFGVGHFSFLDYQLPNNYNKSHIYRDESQRYPINRSSSGLVQLCPSNFYREIYRNFTGENADIIVKRTFAVPIEESYECEDTRLFGQGMVTRISWMTVMIRNVHNINNNNNSLKRDSSDEDYYSSKSESSFSTSPSKSTLSKPESSFSTSPSRSISSKIRRSSPSSDRSTNISDLTVRQSTDDNSPVDNSEDYSDSLESIDSSESINSLESITSCSSLESINSLESITSGPSLVTVKCRKITDACWICRRKCNAKCCGGKCGSKSCKLAIDVAATIKTVKQPVSKPKINMSSYSSGGKSVQIAKSLDRYS